MSMYIKYIHAKRKTFRAPTDATILYLWLVHILPNHNITVTDTSRTYPWWFLIKQVCVLSEIHTRSVEPQPKLTFTVLASLSHASFAVNNLLHFYTRTYICYTLFSINLTSQVFIYICWCVVTGNGKSEVNHNKLKTILILIYMWMVIMCIWV